MVASIEVGWFSKTPSVGIVIDGPDRQIMFHVSLGAYIYLRLPWPRKLTPVRKSSYDGSMIPEEREIDISIHSWGLWWSLWKKRHEWNSSDPKWMSGGLDFGSILFGKHKCEFRVITQEDHVISFYEGNYKVVVTQKERIDTWPRWFTKRSIAYEVVAAPKPIPIEGKGENSWDCGESATESSHFPSRDCKDCYDAALYFEKHMKEGRRKYGGHRWVPREHRDKEIAFA